MRHFLAFICLAVIQTASYAANDEVLDLLRRDLGEAIEVEGNNEIRYCPDNTCDLYKITTPHNDFSSFVYLHLFYESGYIYLNESFGEDKPFRKVAVEESRIRGAVSHYCQATPVTPKCILKGMQEQLGILVGSGRYDEGSFCYGFSENENICKKL
ncbi:hypothetical protein [Sulfurivermis fontis]|uniref:hypothetical protein n=1 Tax=Sulfurivermis fontis TaxID=1972068 RepID=UPI000FDC380A|nr:hypothetical protein [Sulfurivermis fontis]